MICTQQPSLSKSVKPKRGTNARSACFGRIVTSKRQAQGSRRRPSSPKCGRYCPLAHKFLCLVLLSHLSQGNLHPRFALSKLNAIGSKRIKATTCWTTEKLNLLQLVGLEAETYVSTVKRSRLWRVTVELVKKVVGAKFLWLAYDLPFPLGTKS